VNNYKYLIIGGGMTADAAVEGIREIDPLGSIGLVSMETDPPYNRPPLSKGLWKGKPLDKIWLNTENKNATLHLGRRIVVLDADNLTAEDNQGNIYRGDKILLAVGGKPRRLPFGGDAILYYRTLKDYQRLLGMTVKVQNFAVIGGGFIGVELAAALAMNGKNVTMLFPEDRIGARMYPVDLSQYLNNFYMEKGVTLLPGETVTSLSTSGGCHTIKTKSGKELTFDGVIAGIGIELNLDLPKAAGLKVGNGISVDESLTTSHPNIFAAGDVAEFYNPAMGRLMRVEHEDNALMMGRQAGRNMAGAGEQYHHLPYFFSDLFELGYEAVGELDARLTTVADWVEPFKKGIIYYFKEDRVSGVLLWNVWDKVPSARELIAKPGPFKPEYLHSKKSVDWKIAY
jgi:3-phenylpropionate/trans-cinnamate dioxygenase ferredoxin reductase component